MSEKEQFLIVTTMKNEGPFMIDWIAYHLSIGFDDVLIYTNDCDDGTDAIAIRLQELGYAHHQHNQLGKRATPQNRAHMLSMKHDSFAEADWVISLDVDEYINIRLPSGSIKEFVSVCGRSNAISICWKMFGNAGQKAFRDLPVPEQFLQCTEENSFPNYKTRAFKTLFRNDGTFNRYRAHRPRIDPEAAPDSEAPYAGVIWRDSGGNLTDADKVRWRAWRGFSHAHARLHHYALRSADSFLVKRDRGRTNHVGQDQGLEYWNDFNHNDAQDDSILRHLPAMKAVKDEMLRDASLAALHQQACDWHASRAADLRARPEWSGFVAALYDEEKAG